MSDFCIHISVLVCTTSISALLSLCSQDFRLDAVSAAEFKGGDSKSLSNDPTLEECLERFTEPESLTQEDAW